MKKILFSLVFITILSGIPGLRGQSVYSDFFSTDEGWKVIDYLGYEFTLSYNSSGGNPGGYIFEDNAVNSGSLCFKAPSKFLGNKSAAYNRSISFDLLLSDTTDLYKNDADLYIGGSAMTLEIDLPKDTLPGSWQHFIVTLNENSGWRIGTLTGQVPTHQNFIDVLSNITIIGIKGKFSDNEGTGGIDNVYLSTSSPISTFDIDYEGWRVIGDVQGGSGMPNYHPTGGNPGGYLSAVDDATGDTWYWQAPGKFLGDKAGTYGQFLRFDLKQSDVISQFDDYDIILQGPAYNLVFNTPNNPDTT